MNQLSLYISEPIYIYTQQKKLRKLCLRGYEKTSETFKDILISQYYTVSIFFSIYALFGFVVPIASSKSNVKVDWSSHHFSQNFNIRIKHGFSCNNVVMSL